MNNTCLNSFFSKFHRKITSRKNAAHSKYTKRIASYMLPYSINSVTHNYSTVRGKKYFISFFHFNQVKKALIYLFSFDEEDKPPLLS